MLPARFGFQLFLIVVLTISSVASFRVPAYWSQFPCRIEAPTTSDQQLASGGTESFHNFDNSRHNSTSDTHLALHLTVQLRLFRTDAYWLIGDYEPIKWTEAEVWLRPWPRGPPKFTGVFNCKSQT